MLCSLTSLLVACANNDVKPITTRVDVERIEVPIATRCVKPADIPLRPYTRIPDNADTKQKAAGIGADLLAYDREFERIDALLRACASAQ